MQVNTSPTLERKKNEYRGPFPATYSLFSLGMSTYDDAGSDVHALTKELAIRRVEHRSKIHSNESQHLAEGTEVARFRRRFSFVLQQALSFHTRHHLCRQGVALAGTRQLRPQGPVSVHAHRTKCVTGSEGREGMNWVGGGNGDVNGDGDGNGAETRTGVEANKGTQDGNGDGSGDEAERERGRGWRPVDEHRIANGDGDGDKIESSSGNGNEDKDGNGDGNADGIGEGGKEAI